MSFKNKLLALQVLCALSFVTNLQAETIAYCGDYFRETWNTRIDMNSAETGVLEDIPDLQIGTIGALTYSGGVLDFTTTSTSPRVTLLQYTVVGSIPTGTRYGERAPIDPNVYRYFVTHMYSASDAVAQIIWYFAHDHYATTTFDVRAGWNTYTVDLQNATPTTPSSGSPLPWTTKNVTGITFVPVNTSGTNVKIDWIQLARTGCTDYSTTYNGSGMSTTKQLVVDTNNDPSDGVQAKSTPGTSTSPAIARAELFPGTYQMYGFESTDWRTLKVGAPFNMSDSSQIMSLNQTNIGSLSFSNGKFSGTTTGNDPSFYLNLPIGHTIDPTVYRFLSMGIEFGLPGADENGQLFVFTEAGAIHQFNFTAANGAQVRNFDLSSVSGPIRNIRIDPTDLSGRTFALDWVAIQTDMYAAAQPSISTTAIDTLTVQDLSLAMLQPDEKGGTDFAQTVLGKAWNMSSTSDFVRTENLASALIYPDNELTDPLGDIYYGDYFMGTNITNNGDPIQYSVIQNANIDTSRFYRLCYRAWNKNEVPVYNSVARVIWADPRQTAGSQESIRDGDDIVFNRGAQEYCLDLSSTTDSQTEPPQASGAPSPWTDISANGFFVDFFRLDLNENSEAGYYSVLDYIHLRSEHDANTQFAIVVDAPLSMQVDLYYSSTAATSGGTSIGTLAAGRNTNVYKWNTTDIPAGNYYVYASMISGGNELRRLSKGRVLVSHSRTQDSTAPILVCERPDTGYAFDSLIEVTGYALDETRLATVEVFTSTDGVTYTYLDNITPNLFHLAARNAYSTYSESNNPGFQEQLPGTGLAYGAAFVKVVATDTAGNESSCTRSVTRAMGAATPVYTYAPPSGTPQAITVQATPTATATPVPPSLRVTSKKNKVTYTVSNCSSDGVIYAASSASKLESNPTAIGQTTTTGVSSNVPGLKTKKGQSNSIHLKVVCNGRSSATVTLNAKKIKSNKKKPLEAIIKALAKFKAG